MNVPVLIEPAGENGFRATSAWPYSITVEGPTRDEVLERLREQIKSRMVANDANIVYLHFAAPEYRELPPPGDLKDNPLVDEWVQAMADYRRSVDEDPDAW